MLAAEFGSVRVSGECHEEAEGLVLATATMSQHSAGPGKRCRDRTSEAALVLQLRRTCGSFMNQRALQRFVCRSCRGETERSGQALCPCGELRQTWQLKSAVSSLSSKVLSFLRWAAPCESLPSFTNLP